MYLEKRKISKSEIKRISVLTNILLSIIFVVLLFAFWSTQVLKNQYYNTLATLNITKDIEVKAPRGLILDRHHNRLSENKLKFSLFLVREYSKNMETTIRNATYITGKSKQDIQKKIDKFSGHPLSFRIPLERNVPLQKVIYIESRSDEMPEFEFDEEPSRAYPHQEMASHILGYISELTDNELKQQKDQGYKLGDIMGKSGIERQYEADLKGTKGVRTVAKDNLGRIREVLNMKEPVIGHSIVLTIDIQLQQYIEEIFQSYKGTIGVVDLKSGGLLALVNRPNFNPEFFSGVLEPKDWQALINNPDNPLQNKFLQGLYSPGSTFKIVVTLAALEENAVDTSTISLCTGSVKIYDRVFHCWQGGGHGSLKIEDALKNSCNVFFYRLGKKLDIDDISKYAHMLGLGTPAGIDLPNENNGLIPSKAWKQETLHQKWFPGETISVAIGGGMLNITPIQALKMISTVALRGRMPQLHLLKAIEDNGIVVRRFQPRFTPVAIARENFEIVIEGLYRVVNAGGTGNAARIQGKDICGKTGTQQVISKEHPNYAKLVKLSQFKPHAWFVSFAPRNDPRYAMVIFVENGGDAGGIAAPLASKIYKKIFEIDK